MTIPESVVKHISQQLYANVRALESLPLPARLALAAYVAGPEHVVVPKERVERMWCKACGTVTRDDSCDCTRLDTGTQQLQNYADGLLADLRKLTASQAQEGEQLTEKDNV